MTRDTLLLVGRAATNGRTVLEHHADALAQRPGVDAVSVATYDTEPTRDLRADFQDVSGDRVFAVPMVAAHDHQTVDGVPAALSYVDGDVHYCEPPGTSPAVTEVVAERARESVSAPGDAALVLVAFGSSSKPFHRQAVEYHATRLRDDGEFAEVVPAYLLQNPAVECARYAVTADRAVAVPLFLARSTATEERIPTELELDRGGIAYAPPLGDHARVTDAVYGEFCKQRALCEGHTSRPSSFEASLAASRQPVATDGEGP